MTINAVIPRAVFDGNGSAHTFPFQNDGTDIAFIAAEEIVVVERSALGVDTILTQDVHYTVNIEDDTSGVYTGSLTRIVVGVPTALPNNAKWSVYRNTPFSQDTNLIDLGDFSSEAIERALDYRTRVDQEVRDLALRALKKDVFDSRYEAGGLRITGLAEGSAPTDAVTMQQLADAVFGTIDFPASVITFEPVPPLTATTVQDAIEEIVSLFGDPLIVSISGLTFGVDSFIYGTGVDTAAAGTITAFGRSLVDDANAGAALTTLGFSAFMQTLVDDVDAATARATLGVGIGSAVQAWDADLDALAANSTSGFWARTGAGTGAARTLTQPAAGLTITNPAGTAGNPTFAFANDLAALEGLGSTGFAVRSAVDTWLQRSIAVLGAGLSISNGDGVAGNPTISLADDVAAIEALTPTNDDVLQRKSGAWTNRTIAQLLTDLAAPGTTFQPLATNLTSWASVTRAAGFDAFVATPSLANLATLLTNEASGFATFLQTPSSANLAAFLTDETGTGLAVFNNSPTFITPTLGVAAATSITVGNTGLTVGASVPFSDSAGVLTLQNVDALDATTESTIEAAIDTLANLTSIQGVAFTFGAYAATLLNNANEAAFKAAVNLEPGVDYQAYDAELAAIAGLTSAADKGIYFTGAGAAALFDLSSAMRTFLTTSSVANLMSVLTDDASGLGTFLTTPSSANFAALLTDETGTGANVFGTSPTLTTSLLMGSGFVMNWNGGDVLLTHSANQLAFTGAASGYAFDSHFVLSPQAAPAYAAGKLVYDSDNECLTFFNNDSNVALQIGQEQWIRVRNVSGSTIANGAAVYITGSNSGLPTIALANANTEATSQCIGLATQSIANNANGYVTVGGRVNGIDTSAFSAGATVYLSTTNGVLTATIPSSPNFRIRVGIVGVSNASTGTIHVSVGSLRQGFGTANQVVGMNSGATGTEYKTVAGTANEIAVAHAANAITLSLPSALTFTGKTITGGTLSGTTGLASGHVFSWNAGDVLLTHSANLLAFTGAANGYTFDNQVSAVGLVDSAAFTLSGSISPSQITSNQNDYAPTGFATAFTLRLSTDASRIITGLAGGADGRMIAILNVGAQDIVLADQSASSTAANRFVLGGDVTIPASGGILMRYDGTASRWQRIADTVAGTGGGGGAPDNAQYLVAAANGTLSAERVTTDTASITWDHSTGGQAKANVVPSALAGKQTIWIPASAMIPRSTNGAAGGTAEMTTNRNMVKTLDFDTTTQEFAQFEIAMPKSWDEGTVTFQPVWSHASTTVNFGVVWSLAGVATSDDDALDVAFGTVQTSTDTGGTTNDRYVGPESAAITIAGSPAEGDVVQFQIARVPANGSDTMAIDARLHGIKLYFTTNALTDA